MFALVMIIVRWLEALFAGGVQFARKASDVASWGVESLPRRGESRRGCFPSVGWMTMRFARVSLVFIPIDRSPTSGAASSYPPLQHLTPPRGV